jgi:hypothetical protein
MVNITLSMTKEIKKEMDSFKEINWSEVARNAIKEKIIMLKKFEEFTKNSKITNKDSINLGRKLKNDL